jgi:hypothetical protein
MKNQTSLELDAFQIVYKGSKIEKLDFELSGELTMDQTNCADKIVLIRTNLPVEIAVKDLQEKGAKGVVVLSFVYIMGGYLQYRITDYNLLPEIYLPIVELGVNHSKILWNLYSSDQIFNMTLLPDESDNPWTVIALSPWIYVWQAVLGPHAIANIVLASIQFKRFIDYYGGCRASVALYVLGIELGSNLIRIVSLIDMFGYYGIYPDWTRVFFSEVNFPFVVSSFLLFSLFWHELMNNASLKVHPFIRKMRIPFYAASFGFIIVQVAMATCRNLGVLEDSRIVSSSLYFAISIGLIVFYTINGVKLLKKIKLLAKKNKTNALKRTTIKILISTGCLLCLVILGGVFAIGVPYNPIGYIVAWFFTFAVINSASTMSILACNLPENKSSTGSSNRPVTPLNSGSAVDTHSGNTSVQLSP